MKMKAICLDGFGGPEVLKSTEIERPEPDKGQLLVRVEATSVNRPDIIQRQGNYPPPPGDSEIPGLEVAGVVAGVGPECRRFKEGDRVLALVGGGGYAEYAVAHEGHAMAIPSNLDAVAAACICETYITAYLNLFMIGALGDGQWTLIHGGGGGVANAGIQLCRQLVPNTQIISTASKGKLERVTELGAHHVADYRSEDFAARVAELTGKRGVNVILDHMGASYLERNLKSLAVGGTLMLIGVMGGVKSELNLAVVMVKRQRIIGSVLRSRPVEEKAFIIETFERNVMPLFADGRLEPIIEKSFALSDVADAHRLMEAGGHFGKIPLRVGEV